MDIAGHGSKIAILYRGVNVDDPSDIVMRDNLISCARFTDATSPRISGFMPSRSTAVASETSKTDPTPRDRHLTCIAERGRIGWQKASGYNKRSRVEATIGRFKQVIGNGLRSQTDTRQNTEVAVAIHVLNRSLACFEVATSASWTHGCTTRDIAGFTQCEVS